jgi:REP element-mobilizing transposase RayT
MTHNQPRYHRRSIRLPTYDYAQAGAYFVTMVTHQRQCLFGEIVGGQMRLAAYGQVVSEQWLRSALVRGEIELDAFIVMPNHIHGIVIMRVQPMAVGAHGRAPLPSSLPYRPPRSLGSLVAGFKSAATKRINEIRGTLGVSVWQRNYYERVIRNGEELNRVRQYIIDNPAHWEQDRENPNNVGAVREPPLPD